MKEKKKEAENTLVKNTENGQVKRNIPEISAHWRPEVGGPLCGHHLFRQDPVSKPNHTTVP